MNQRGMNQKAWWRTKSLRARLLVFSLPVSVVLIIAVAKLWTVVIAGGSAGSDFTERNTDALRGDVAALGVFNVVEPAKSHYAAGTLAVLDDHLDEADRQFTEALARTEAPRSCSVRVNLELVKETLGDRAAGAFEGPSAVGWYRSALDVVGAAPTGCFSGSTDADLERRAVLDATVARLNDKIAAASVAPPPPPPPPDAPPPPPPPTAASGSTPAVPDSRLRLNPGVGDPLDRLQQILRDAAAAQNGG
jgi:hypothetical protein